MVETRLIDGKAAAAALRAGIAAAAAALKAQHGIVPGLAAVLVGDDPASEVYVRSKAKATRAAGLDSFEHRLPATTSEAELLAPRRRGSTPIPRSTASWCSCRCRQQIDAAARHRGDRPGQGCRRLPPAECRATVERRRRRWCRARPMAA